jgi:hypothetical protein|tara:strand:- start:196 stop:363 length:168 start_codon:yes stop_codon:yes gene_type:complete
MKYFKHIFGEQIRYYAAENALNVNIPHAEDNMDFVRMMEEVDAGTSTIEEVEDDL